MRNYTNFKVIEGTYANVVNEFDTLDAALTYIEEEYGADNAVEQLVQIDASNPKEEIEETFNELEIYDMLTEQ
jgi:SLT domain-containing protein